MGFHAIKDLIACKYTLFNWDNSSYKKGGYTNKVATKGTLNFQIPKKAFNHSYFLSQLNVTYIPISA
ncbi:hypothetical protein BFP75_00445 [Maribacter sp. 4G9]|nr:hypothetical protein BFP75_00445 [Maribacter sp. 4G9]